MSPDDIKSIKGLIRERIWREMESRGVASFPFPIRGRVPNFLGSTEAALRMRDLEEYLSAKTIMVNPDSPQLPVRRMCLRDGKRLLMATPALRKGLVVIDPGRAGNPEKAATIGGAIIWGKPADPRAIRVDLIVEGSVAVDVLGGRVGKGAGWGDLEYAILRESGAADDEVKVATTVHDIQVVEEAIPMEPHDMPVDIVLTPTRTLMTSRAHPKPRGISWEKLEGDRLALVRRILGT
ncbi:MAG: 5-formyltetrahydrofolate cyclo-ligase [Candidatus Hadarchaeales archaeon]